MSIEETAEEKPLNPEQEKGILESWVAVHQEAYESFRELLDSRDCSKLIDAGKAEIYLGFFGDAETIAHKIL